MTHNPDGTCIADPCPEHASMTADPSAPWYLLRNPDLAASYIETQDPAAATLQALMRRTCDECRGPISWSSRTVLTHGATNDHQTVYLTVVCPLCLPTVADRLSLR